MPTRSDPGAEPPDTTDLTELRQAARDCRGCDLYRDATTTVFGAGANEARVFALGEQPGDQEDRHGEPFVGPAGHLLDRALDDAGIDRDSLYLTNAVKHFKFKLRGKRRIHEKPARSQIVACRPWLESELRAVRPQLVLLLGATAAQSLYGTAFRLTRHRGETLEPPEEYTGLFTSAVATVHPSAILRAPDRQTAYDGFVADLRGLRGANSGAGSADPGEG